MMSMIARMSLKAMTAAALSALAGCVAAPAQRDFQPAPVADVAPASAPIVVAALDPLNAPPPPAADPMLVPPPGAETASSQRVPLNTLAAAAPPPAPTSLLQPPAAATAPAQKAAAALTPPPVAPPQLALPQAASVQPMPAPPVTAPPTPKAEPAPTAPARQTVPAAPALQTAVVAPTVQPAVPPAPASPPLRLRVPPGATPTPAASDDATVVISSSTTRTMAPREFVPASLTPAPAIAAPGPGDIPLTAGEKNIIQRFEILKRLEDEALITHDEYMKRRTANAGGLLPYTHQPAAEGLERPVPSADAIVARLAALRRSFEMRAITPQQHALERTMILNALLPETPEDRTDPRPPPADMIEGAAAAGHLERLREKNLISAEELATEKNAIEHAVTTGLLPSQEPARTAARKPAANTAARPAPAAAAKPAAPESALAREITGPVLHIASYRSEASAMKGWDEVYGKNKTLLANVKPIVRRVELGEQGVFYRLMAGSYTSMADAESACVKLKEAGQFCRASATGG
jgi:hypothetical protein